MKKAHILIIALIIGSVILAGCVAAQQEQQKHTKVIWIERIPQTGSLDTLEKYTIPEDNVTCYVFGGIYRGGISCIRDDVK